MGRWQISCLESLANLLSPFRLFSCQNDIQQNQLVALLSIRRDVFVAKGGVGRACALSSSRLPSTDVAVPSYASTARKSASSLRSDAFSS
jgi:hypothetical protein